MIVAFRDEFLVTLSILCLHEGPGWANFFARVCESHIVHLQLTRSDKCKECGYIDLGRLFICILVQMEVACGSEGAVKGLSSGKG